MHLLTLLANTYIWIQTQLTNSHHILLVEVVPQVEELDRRQDRMELLGARRMAMSMVHIGSQRTFGIQNMG